MRSLDEVRMSPVWRLWRRWLPASFRERHELELLRDHVERAQRRGTSRARFWLRLLWDAVATGVAARFDAGPRAHATPARGRSNASAAVLRHVGLTMRKLARRPAFAIGIIAMLALAIGANLTMFSIVDRLLLSPPSGVADAALVRRFYMHGPTLFDAEPVHSSSLSYPEYAQLRDVAAFDEVAAHTTRELTLGTGADAERVQTEFATASYFGLLGVQPALGRLFDADDDDIDAANPVAVLSHTYWQRRFGGDPRVLGRVLAIGSGRYTVIGVAEDGFHGVEVEATDVWLPLHVAGRIEYSRGWTTSVGWSWIRALVRLTPDHAENIAAAEAEATARIHAAREGMPDRFRESRAVLASLILARGPNPMREADVARLLLGLSAVVLLISCANVVNLLFARGVQQRRERAVQRALGAGRLRLALESMTETLLLVAAAGTLAFIIATVVGPAVFQLLVPGASRTIAEVDRTFAVGAAIVAGVVALIGLVPSWRASGPDPMEALKGRGAPRSAAWLRRSLLAVQAAFSIVLLIGAGLFVRSLQRATAVDLGIGLETITIDIELEDGTTFGSDLADAVYAAYGRVRAHPAVASATITSIVPFGGGWGIDVTIPGRGPIPTTATGPFFVSAGPDYFGTVGIPLLRGRTLTAEDDREGAERVAVVNEAMAALAWPAEDALGRCMHVGDDTDMCTRVVGIVANYRTELTSQDVTPYFYIAPHHPGIGSTAANVVLVRMARPVDDAVTLLRDEVLAASPDIRFANVAPLSERVEPQLRAWRVGAGALTALGLLALLVAAGGLYAVLAFEVSQRRYELAIRAALGASAVAIVHALATRTLLFTAAGIAAGLVLAAVLGRVVQALLFDVRATDPAVYAGAVLVLGTAAFAAVLLPLFRARVIEPMHALREE